MSNETIECLSCKSTGLNPEDKFCPNCSYPYNGTDHEKKMFRIQKASNSDLLDLHETSMKRARYAIYILGVFQFLALLAFDDIASIISLIFSGVVLITLGMLSKKKAPFLFLLSALILFIIMLLLTAIQYPDSLLKGILIRIIFFYFIGKGVMAAKDYEELKSKNSFFYTPKDFS